MIGPAATIRGVEPSRAGAWLRAQAALQAGHLFPWAPVCLGLGIAGWLALRVEPSALDYAAMALAAAGLLAAAAWVSGLARAAAIGLALVLVGALLAGHRAHSVAGPVIGWRYYGPVEGTVAAVDRSASDKPRVTLEDVVLRDVSPSRTPLRVRLSLHGDVVGTEPEPGARVMTTGHLSPPGGPVEPGGFDFSRKAWFEGLGGVGYTRIPLMLAAPPDGGHHIARTRHAISEALKAALPGETGAVAAAITTGDRGAISPETTQDLRDANLAHLLAISGLHMGLLTGFVFGALRYGLALVPPLALRVPAKSLAAGVALVAASGYLALSGGAVATERAYVMVSVMLVAVLLGRRAISVRSIALAAVVVLVLRPEALAGPGFQMSFAATLALVAGFEAIRSRRHSRRASGREMRRLPWWLAPVVAVLTTSAIAGLATGPIAAVHFNRVTHYGLIANLLSVPVMGSVVVPAAVIAGVLWPLGLGAPALWVMGLGIDWILLVADWVAGLDGAASLVPSPPTIVLPMLILGGLFAALWRGRLRLAGAAPMALSLVLWAGAERPSGLVSHTGGLVGWMGEGGRALSKPRGDGFSGRVWLENDGDWADQATAAGRLGGEGWRVVTMADGRALVHLPGKRGPDGAPEACRDGAVLVLSEPWDGAGDCLVLDSRRLGRTGSVAILRDGATMRLVTARDRSGARLWTDEDVRRGEGRGLLRRAVD